MTPTLLLVITACSSNSSPSISNNQIQAATDLDTRNSFNEGFDTVLTLIEKTEPEYILFEEALYGYEEAFLNLAVETQNRGEPLDSYFRTAGRTLWEFVGRANDLESTKVFLPNLRTASLSQFEDRQSLENLRSLAVDYYETWIDLGNAFYDALGTWMTSWAFQGDVGLIYETVQRAREPYEDRLNAGWRELCDALVSNQPGESANYDFESRIRRLCY